MHIPTAPVVVQISHHTPFLKFAVWAVILRGSPDGRRKSLLRTGPPPTPSINGRAEVVCIGWVPPSIRKGSAFIPQGVTHEGGWARSTDPLRSCLCSSCFRCYIREYRLGELSRSSDG